MTDGIDGAERNLIGETLRVQDDERGGGIEAQEGDVQVVKRKLMLYR